MHSRAYRVAKCALLFEACIGGFYPVLIKTVSQEFPPVLFMTLSVSIAVCSLVLYCAVAGKFRSGIDMLSFGYAAIVAILVLSGFLAIFVATRYTSAINTAVLLQNEMLIACIVGMVLLGERLTAYQVAGIICVLVGTVCILFNGAFSLNRGDIIILCSTVVFPFANALAKKGLARVAPSVFLLMRYIVGMILLSILSLLIEDPVVFVSTMQMRHIIALLLYGIPILTLAKILWYTGLRVLPLGIATNLASSSPLFSLLFAYLLLGEVPTIYQWTGFICSVVGVYLLIQKTTPSTVPVDLV